jgi:hypothetical protein
VAEEIVAEEIVAEEIVAEEKVAEEETGQNWVDALRTPFHGAGRRRSPILQRSEKAPFKSIFDQ